MTSPNEQEKVRIDSHFNKNFIFRNNLTGKINEYKDLDHPDLSRLMDEDIQEITSKYDTRMYEQNFRNFEQDSEKMKMFFNKVLVDQVKKIASLGLPNLDILIKQEDKEGVENNEGHTLPTLNLSLSTRTSYRIPSYLMIENLDDTLNITTSTTLNEDFFIDSDTWRGVKALKVTLCSVTLNANDIMILDHLLKKFDQKYGLILCCRSLNTDNLSQEALESKLIEIFNILFSNSKFLHSVDIRWEFQNSSEILMKFINKEVLPKVFSLTSLKIHLPKIADPIFKEFLNSLSPVQQRLEIFEFIAALNYDPQTPLTNGLVMPKLKEFVFKIRCIPCNNEVIHGEGFDKFFEESLQSMKCLKKLAFYLKSKSDRNLLKIFQIIQNMPGLENLDTVVQSANHVQTIQQITKLISDPLSRMKNLRTLSLGVSLLIPSKFLKQEQIQEFIQRFANISQTY